MAQRCRPPRGRSSRPPERTAWAPSTASTTGTCAAPLPQLAPRRACLRAAVPSAVGRHCERRGSAPSGATSATPEPSVPESGRGRHWTLELEWIRVTVWVITLPAIGVVVGVLLRRKVQNRHRLDSRARGDPQLQARCGRDGGSHGAGCRSARLGAKAHGRRAGPIQEAPAVDAWQTVLRRASTTDRR